MKRLTLKAGESLFEKGDRADNAYLILNGTIEISTGTLKAQIGREELFGESGLVGNDRQASASAITDCTLMELTANELKNDIRTDPDTSLLIIEALIKRLAHALDELDKAHTISS